MKIAQINMIPYGSTGKIMLQIAETARRSGHEARSYTTIPYQRTEKPVRVIQKELFTFGSYQDNCVHYYLGSLLGRNGCFSHRGTHQLIRLLDEFQPDILHLHNLHKFCINLPMLFRYIKKSNIRIVWTLHDCWAFTGQCPYFTMAECDKWKTGCCHCPQTGVYPRSRIDNSKRMYALKRHWFTGIAHMTLVTPSQWLAGLVKQSFLKEYPVKVIHNGIDLDVFRPTPSDFRARYGIAQDKFVLLGVSFGWGKRKGLDVFIELSKRLDSRFQLVLVGTDDKTDRRLLENIISIHRTESQQALAEVYSAADLFVNPTREENYPTVNMESLACGTPVLTFKTGGSPEISDESCGSVVDKDDIDAMEKEIIRICTERPFSKESCLNRAREFDMNKRFEEYIELYRGEHGNEY